MHKVKERILSILLMLVMVIGLLPTSNVMAQEELLDAVPMYIAEITDVEHGKAVFENDTSSAIFAEGDSVNVKIEAEDGYQFERLKVTDTNDAPIDVAFNDRDDLDDDIVFAMPASDIIIEAEFKEISASESEGISDIDAQISNVSTEDTEISVENSDDIQQNEVVESEDIDTLEETVSTDGAVSVEGESAEELLTEQNAWDGKSLDELIAVLNEYIANEDYESAADLYDYMATIQDMSDWVKPPKYNEIRGIQTDDGEFYLSPADTYVGTTKVTYASYDYVYTPWGLSCGNFYVTGGIHGFCGAHEAALTPAGTVLNVYESTSSTLRKVLYYGAFGPGDLYPSNGWDYNLWFGATSLACSVLLGHSDNKASTGYSALYYDPGFSSLAAPPSTFHVYIGYPDSSSYQPVVYYVIEEEKDGDIVFGKTVKEKTGSLTVTKNVTKDIVDNATFEFTLTIDGNVAAGYKYTGSKSGKTDSNGKFTLTNGQTITISGIPAGAKYRVTENTYSDYETTVTDESGTHNRSYGAGTMGSAGSDTQFSFKISGLDGTYDYKTYNGTKLMDSGKVKNNGTIKLKAGYDTRISGIPAGTKVTVTETGLGTGWVVNTESKSGTIPAGDTNILSNFVNTYTPPTESITFGNERQFGSASLQKVSAIPEATTNNSCYSLQGAKYGVYTNKECTSLYKEATTDANGQFTINNIPFGTYWVKEISPSNGYGLDANIYSFTLSKSNKNASIQSVEPVDADPISIIVQKIDTSTESGEPKSGADMSKAEYTVKYYTSKDCSGTPVKTWVFVTNESGVARFYDTWLKSGSDTLYKDASGQPIIPLGSFTIQETVAPDDYYIDSTVYKYEVTTNAITNINHDPSINPVDTYPELVITKGATSKETPKPPVIKTTIVEKDSNSHFAELGQVELVDTISYQYLETKKEYSVVGVLMDKETGEPVLGKDGTQITSEPFSFTPSESKGSVNVSFIFDSSDLEGKTVVAFEKFTYNDEDVVSHEDINDDAQTIYFPEIKTTLRDNIDDEHDAIADTITLIDTVSYQNLCPGDTYTVKGMLKDQKTGNTILDKNGNEVTAETTFSPSASNGTVDVTFEFDASNLKNTTLVAFEILYRGDKFACDHTDITDTTQTVYIPEIRTSLKDSVDSDIDADATKNITLIDTVSYKNLIPGREYVVTGKLMDKDTGKAAVDDNGAEITAETKFTAEKADGTTTVTFEFSGVSLAGHSVVAFEDLYRNNKHVAVHANINDKEQTVDIPEIHTSLKDTIDNEPDALASEDVKLVDVVSYNNLIVGREYTMRGILMDQATGKPALDDDGNQITATETFTAESKDGTIALTFTFSGLTLAGHSVVAFEDLYRGEKHVAVHADINDKNQTVDIPEIGTSLKDTIDDDIDALAAENIVLRDTVSYKNLRVGEEYLVTGILMDKESGDPALDDDGNYIEAESTFVANSKNGSVDVVFEFSGVSLANHTVVAFESIYHNGKVVAVHCDIDDFDQSVFIPRIYTSLRDDVDNEQDAYATENITLIDTVTYENLIPGREYVMQGQLMDKETGEPSLDDNGDEIVAQTVFTPEEANGTVDVIFTFSGVSLAGHSVVAFENLYRDGKHVAVHTDITDKDQTVDIPKIGTSLKDSIDGANDALADEEIILVDTVSYENVHVGRDYTIRGILMDKVTGEPALDDNGDEITSEVQFTAEEAEGTIELTFTFSGVSLAGHSVVAFETMYRDEKEIAIHADIEDIEQTVDIPEISTSLKDSINDANDAYASENIVLVDTVTYKNMHVGEEYVVSGTLMNKNTGEPAVDDNGNIIVSELVTFVPENTDGTIDITFAFSGVSLAGQTVVAFETITHNDKEVAVHEDIEDEDQTVYIPLIYTELLESATALHNAYNNEQAIVLTDIIFYENLVPGREYLVYGKLMDKATGEVVKNSDGTEVESEVRFTPESVNGSVNMTFTIDKVSEDGLMVVAFEKLFSAYSEVTIIDDETSDETNDDVFGEIMEDDAEETNTDAEAEDDKNGTETNEEIVMYGFKLVADHQDISDMHQTVGIPAIRTTLTGNGDLKFVNGYSDVTLFDKVDYSNLYPGKEYKIDGILMDKETGNPIVDNDGNQVTSTVTFVPSKTSGSVILKFEFFAPSYVGKSIVAFESLYEQDVLIATHADINDVNQTVDVLMIKTLAHNGDDGKMFETALNNTVIDTVSYSYLEPNKEYIMHATLMDKATGKAIQIDGSDLTGDKKFVPEQDTGTVNVEIKVPAGAFSGTMVVFEQLIDATTGQVICVHEDLDDVDQTVYFTALKTQASFKDGTKEASLVTEQVIVDVASYEGLEPGHEYVITGTLINKETGKVVTSLGKPVTTELTFKPEAANGSINVELVVPMRTVKGSTVCFEVITDKQTGEVVCSHQDINDVDQTVTFYNTPTPRTGDTNMMWLWIAIGCAALAVIIGFGIYFIKKRRG